MKKLFTIEAVRGLFLLLVSGLYVSCSKSHDSSSSPEISIQGVIQDRSTTSSMFRFQVSLSKATTNAVTVHFSTAEGTAKENIDFKPATGTLTINANEVNGIIEIEVSGDSLRTTDKAFSVQLDNPGNCTIKTAKATGLIVNANGLYLPVDNTGYISADSYPGYTLAWSDEFNGKTIDANSWNFESGNNNGWGNNELEYYTGQTKNAFVSTGNLVIEARQESLNEYTSARMISKNKRFFKFGRVDIRAKLPTGKGIWPALWMLGNNIDQVGWPACGEIDILELLGQEPNKIYGTLHWGESFAQHASKGDSYVLNSGSFDQQFHVYSTIWTQDTVKILVDDAEYLTVNASDVGAVNPFNNDFFFIFNIAVGGNWPGSPDNTTSFPQRMFIDYIRVFQ